MGNYHGCEVSAEEFSSTASVGDLVGKGSEYFVTDINPLVDKVYTDNGFEVNLKEAEPCVLKFRNWDGKWSERYQREYGEGGHRDLEHDLVNTTLDYNTLHNKLFSLDSDDLNFNYRNMAPALTHAKNPLSNEVEPCLMQPKRNPKGQRLRDMPLAEGRMVMAGIMDDLEKANVGNPDDERLLHDWTLDNVYYDKTSGDVELVDTRYSQRRVKNLGLGHGYGVPKRQKEYHAMEMNRFMHAPSQKKSQELEAMAERLNVKNPSKLAEKLNSVIKKEPVITKKELGPRHFQFEERNLARHRVEKKLFDKFGGNALDQVASMTGESSSMDD